MFQMMPSFATPLFEVKIAEKRIYLRSKRFWHLETTDKGTTIFRNQTHSDAKSAPFLAFFLFCSA